ncbi:MAG TPA: hypothetical protein DCM00_16975 [Alcanivorax sp.]|jgi:hypothetical protein|uniref:hypothetical protein n=1 Tax=Alloalcanivorax venustensis TaxID=172371 RepID=UPI000C96D6B9|nr:hypothetical protein [Alcanivorax sp.]HAJ44311.1 hypothetical protein [Alcanivorax sp.]
MSWNRLLVHDCGPTQAAFAATQSEALADGIPAVVGLLADAAQSGDLTGGQTARLAFLIQTLLELDAALKRITG